MVHAQTSPVSPNSVNPNSVNPNSVSTNTVQAPDAGVPGSWKIALLYDGQCPLCLREVRFLEAQDRGRGIIQFVDVMDPRYNPAEYGGISFEAAMGRIHALKADGSIVQGVEVFRQVYTVLGMGWIYAVTRWPVIRPLVDALYDRWADWRLALTGRPPLAEIARQRVAQGGCDDRCQLPE